MHDNNANYSTLCLQQLCVEESETNVICTTTLCTESVDRQLFFGLSALFAQRLELVSFLMQEALPIWPSTQHPLCRSWERRKLCSGLPSFVSLLSLSPLCLSQTTLIASSSFLFILLSNPLSGFLFHSLPSGLSSFLFLIVCLFLLPLVLVT